MVDDYSEVVFRNFEGPVWQHHSIFVGKYNLISSSNGYPVYNKNDYDFNR